MIGELGQERVISYIDGFNLYFGIKENNWNGLLWLNVQDLTKNLLKPNQILMGTKYFTSRINNNPPKQARQNMYLEALETLPDFNIIYGQYHSQDRTCKKCGRTYAYPSEKMTDVNIACQLLADAYQDKYDTAFLITGDSDLVPPIQLIHKLFPSKRVFIAFPPNRKTNRLSQHAKGSLNIGRKKLLDSQFADQLQKEDKFILNRPNEWR